MKQNLILLLITLASFKIYSQTTKNEYDEELAISLGADDYGMKSYIFVILKTGPVVIENKTVRDSLFSGHLKNIKRLADEDKLVVAGPLGKNDLNYRGIFILNVKTMEEAEKLLDTDPAIKEKLLATEIFSWYGSAALPEYLKVASKIQKISF
ncbi:MAG: hypothetical protein CVT92_10630 [Bacteroidetes bacterium HGW-Bacteroidetes-1]|nr:MAG: hypothetical protein CVT92_10630 [Bacteroidetes bacterium HGW-Bacteroidetes-1]